MSAHDDQPTQHDQPTQRDQPKISYGNPMIPKGDGDGPVQDYISAMPGWKQGVGRTIDAIVRSEMPDARRAVKYNQPIYGAGDDGWFLSFRCFTRHVQVQFYSGASLVPLPPKPSKHGDLRCLELREGDELDEQQLREWIVQASRLPGQKL